MLSKRTGWTSESMGNDHFAFYFFAHRHERTVSLRRLWYIVNMQELTLIQKYDAVLDALYDISGKRPTFGRILALLRVRKIKIEWAEVWDIMGKMRREYLIHPEIQDRTSKIPTEVIHLITIDGKLMKESDGLKGKLEREKPKWHQKYPIVYALICAFGGAILSVIVGIILQRADKQENIQEMKQIGIEIQDANHRLDSLISSLHDTANLKINSSSIKKTPVLNHPIRTKRK